MVMMKTYQSMILMLMMMMMMMIFPPPNHLPRMQTRQAPPSGPDLDRHLEAQAPTHRVPVPQILHSLDPPAVRAPADLGPGNGGIESQGASLLHCVKSALNILRQNLSFHWGRLLFLLLNFVWKKNTPPKKQTNRITYGKKSFRYVRNLSDM